MFLIRIRKYSHIIKINDKKYICLTTNAKSIALGKVDLVLDNMKGVLAYINVPEGVVNVVFYLSYGITMI